MKFEVLPEHLKGGPGSGLHGIYKKTAYIQIYQSSEQTW